jgi:hypothetical protein
VLKGEIMDLQGLDRNVLEVCDAVASLPPAEAQELESRMSDLIEALEQLAGTMQVVQEKIDGGAS